MTLVKSKETGTPATTAPVAETSNVVDLMEALRRSIGGGEAGRPKAGKPGKPAVADLGVAAKPAAKSKAKTTPEAAPLKKPSSRPKKAG